MGQSSETYPQCRTSADFYFWNSTTNDLGPCFFHICLQLPIFSILAIFSAYYIGKRRLTYTIYNSWNSCQSTIIYIRAIVVACLAIIPVSELMIRFGFFDHPIGFLDASIVSLKTFTWMLHLLYILRLKRGISYNTRGPRSIIASWILSGVISALEFRSMYFMFWTPSTTEVRNNDNVLYIWPSGIEALLQGFYLLTIIPGGSHLDERHYRSIFTDYSNAYESDSVLNHETNSFVGFQEEDEEQFYLGRAKDNSGFFSKLIFGWVNQLMMKGSCGYLRYSDDLFELPTKITTSAVATKFQKWTLYARNSLIKSLHICFGWEFYSLAFVKMIADASGFAGPILLDLLIGFIEEEDQRVQFWRGYIYVFGLFLAALIGATANTHFNMWMAEVNLKIRAAIITTIYRKTVLLQRTTLEKFNSGELINYMSSDTNRITNFCPSFHAFWSLPFQIAVSLYLLYAQIGVAFFAGLVFAIILIPINRVIANKIGDLSTKMMYFKDQRVKLMSEILYGIRVLKFHSWESFFIERITDIRQKELKYLRGRKYLDALCVYFWATTPVLVSVFSFGTYVLLGNQLTAAKVFTSLALFNMLISPLNALPWVINGLVEAWVSVKRISSLLQVKETEPHDVYTPITTEFTATHDIVTSSSRFEWGNGAEDFGIDSFTLQIKKGQLIGVVGEVGSGKSSLLLALLGELPKTSGELSVDNINTGFGVVLQEPWIQRGSIRRNILFGKQYNAMQYNELINGCCLEQDLYELEMGEDTIVGDNGATLSGGQKIRLTLARAVYQDKSIYLLDDIYSAVDFKVAKHLHKFCVMGLLKQKTRIICTHHVNFLRDADLILVMDKGQIIKSGTPNEIMPIFFENEMLENENDPSSSSSPATLSRQHSQGLFDLKKTSSATSNLEDLEDQSESITYNHRMIQSGEFINKPDNAPPLEVNEEHGREGTIDYQVYTFYLRAIGRKLTGLILIALLAMQASKNSSDLWLAHWVSQTSSSGNSSEGISATEFSTLSPTTFETYVRERDQSQLENNNKFETSTTELSWLEKISDHIYLIKDLNAEVKYYFTVLIVIGILNSMFTLARAFLFAYGGVKGGTKAHFKLLRVVLYAKMSFFDTTSIGRIINRFSSDVCAVDDSLPFILNIFLAQLYGVLGTLLLTCYALPWILVIIIPLVLVVNNIQQYYRYTARQLRRLSSVSLSPIYAHFSETLKGLVTIRAMRATRNENEAYLEANQRCQYSIQAVSQWLGFRLQMVGVLVITGVGIIGVIQHRLQVAEPGIIGLAISYALTITSSLNGFVTYFTDSEKEMVAVERIHEYVEDIEMESNTRSMVIPPYGWPVQGVLCFRNVCLRYRAGLSYALRNISFETRPYEKIGVVGRTGSGKSSLFQALFRLVDGFEGDIIIDTVNIKLLNLHELRSKIWIIPQDPLIFSGTLRENLDPRGGCSDDELLLTTQKCQLNGLLQQIGGLDGDVGESGSFLSTGQKQLVCLARALLVNAKILCIDEATANVDQETDKIIQATIRTSFRRTTVITVAHRVNTILHSDRVIVMSNGEIVEIDGPEKLMLDKSSHFYQLAQGNV